MRIELDKLTGGKGSFAHQYAAGELSFADERVGLIEPPVVSGRVARDGRQISVSGTLSTGAEVDCDRCLKPITVPINAAFNLQYVTASDYEATHAAELEAADMGLSVFDGEVIDVDEIVREQIWLAVPERALCREDCKGICPFCGGDRNLKQCSCEESDIDPRWAGLKELVKGKS